MNRTKKLLAFLFTFCAVVLLSLALTGVFSVGETYVEIATAEDLKKIGTDYPLDGNYVLTADIDLSAEEWTPIGGTSTNPFSGTFDGNGHVISGMHIGTASTPKAYTENSVWGLFAALENGTVKNIIFENVYCNITVYNTSSNTNSAIGTVCGYIKLNSTIDSVAVLSGSLNATVTHQLGIAGIAGGFFGDVSGKIPDGDNGFTVSNCYNGASIRGISNYKDGGSYSIAAGIVSRPKNFAENSVVNCLNVGTVYAEDKGTSTASRNMSLAAHILNYQGVKDASTENKTTRANNFAIDGLLSAAGVKGAVYTHDVEHESLTVLTKEQAKTSANFAGLGTGWTLKDGYYPLPAALNGDYAVPVDATGIVISIETGAELRKIGTNASYPMSGVYYRLMKDIDLSDAIWTPLGWGETAITEFAGTFDGNGHKISNMHAHGATKNDPYVMPYPHWGLFSNGGTNALIKDLAFENVYFYGTAHGKNTIYNTSDQTNCAIGTVIGYSNKVLTMENVAVLSGYLNGSCIRQTRVGGLLGAHNGANTATFRNCYNGAEITGNFSSSTSTAGFYLSNAGILGAAMQAEGTYVFENCLNVGKIVNPTVLTKTINCSSVGAIVARASISTTPHTTVGKNSSITNCFSVDRVHCEGAQGFRLAFDQSNVTFVDPMNVDNANAFQGLTNLSSWSKKDGYYPIPATLASHAQAIKIISISSVDDLLKIGKDANYPLNGLYRLTADLDLSAVEWKAIGYNGDDNNPKYTYFTGIFDGNGHVISNLHSGTETNPVVFAKLGGNWGLFSDLENAVVRNLMLDNVYINTNTTMSTNTAVGAVCGYIRGNSTIENVAVRSGTIRSSVIHQLGVSGIAGGFTGTYGFVIRNCYNGADIIGITASNAAGSYATAAGIIARPKSYALNTVENCFNAGTVRAVDAKETASTGDLSMAANIVNYQNQEDPDVVNVTTRSGNMALSGLVFAEGFRGAVYNHDLNTTEIVDIFSASDASSFATLTAGENSAWTVKAADGTTAYLPMLKTFVAYSEPIDVNAELEKVQDCIDGIAATNHLTEDAVKAALNTVLSDYEATLTQTKVATAEEEGAFTLDVTFSDGTEKTYTIVVDRLPKLDYAFDFSTPGMAQGTVTVTLSKNYEKGEFALYWGDSNGPLSGYSALTLMDGFTVNGAVLTYTVPDRVAIPATATRLWLYLNGTETGSMELPANRLLSLGNKKYSYGVMSDIHFGSANTPAAFTAAMNLFESANVNFAVSVGDFTEGGDASQYKIFTDTYAAGGWDLTLWSVLGNHDILTWNLKKLSGATSPYDQSELAVTPAQALQNMKDAFDTYANVNYTGANNEYQVTLSPYYPDYDYTVSYGDDLFVYLGIGAFGNTSGKNTDQHLAPNQLVWLEEVLENYYNTGDYYGHVYLIFHYYTMESGFGMYQNGSTSGTEWSQNRNGFMTEGYNSSEEVYKILNKYPNVIHFSGHTHRAFAANNNLSVTRKYKVNADNLTYTVVNEDLGYTAVHVPSLSKGGTTTDEGYLVTVYDNGVLLTGYNFYNGEIVSHANFFLPNDTETVRVRIKENTMMRSTQRMIQYVQGNGEWQDLMTVEELTGSPTTDLELQVTDTHIQWKEASSEGWTDVIALEDLGKESEEVFAPSTENLTANIVGGEEATKIYSVDVAWDQDNFTFEYDEGSEGTWDPQNHVFTGVEEPKWTVNTLKITVTNHSNAAVKATVTVTDQDAADGISVAPDQASKTLPTAEGTPVAEAPTVDFTLTVTGTPVGRPETAAKATVTFEDAE